MTADQEFKITLPSARLEERLAQLEESIQQSLGGEESAEMNSIDQQNLYRLLSAYRGTSESLLDIFLQAVALDWPPWYQERFA